MRDTKHTLSDKEILTWTPDFFRERITAGLAHAERKVARASKERFPVESIKHFSEEIRAYREELKQVSEAGLSSLLDRLNESFFQFEQSEIMEEKLKEMSVANRYASRHTRLLLWNLKYREKGKIFLGMQDATGYGVGWKDDNDRCDIKDVTGQYPVVGSWSGLSWRIGRGSCDFADDIYVVKKFHELGGFNTTEWHMSNPFGASCYTKENPKPKINVLPTLLPGRENHEWYKRRLKHVAHFLRSLKDDNGESIPIILRLFHEHNGDWFWWGKSHCTIEEYKEVWKFSVNFLVEEMHLTNLLFSYSPDIFSGQEEYLERYPGDEYIDILGVDDYNHLGQNIWKKINIPRFVKTIETLADIATEHDKVPALTETGQDKMFTRNWMTKVLLKALKTSEKTRSMAYAVLWRNDNVKHFHVPYVGHRDEKDLVKFCADEAIIMMDEALPFYKDIRN